MWQSQVSPLQSDSIAYGLGHRDVGKARYSYLSLFYSFIISSTFAPVHVLSVPSRILLPKVWATETLERRGTRIYLLSTAS